MSSTIVKMRKRESKKIPGNCKTNQTTKNCIPILLLDSIEFHLIKWIPLKIFFKRLGED